MMPAFALPPPQKVVPIPVPGTFQVTPMQSAKAAQGKIKAKLMMAWDDTIMYSGAKLSIFVQPMNKTVTATLPPRPPGDAIELTMTLDDAVGMAPFAVGPISITSGPKPATQAPTMPVESLVTSTLATAAAATAMAARAMAPPPAPPPRTVVVAQAVSASAPPPPPPASARKVAPKPKAAAKAKPGPKAAAKAAPKAAPRAKAPKRKAALTKQAANKRARATSPPPPHSNRLGRTIKAASRFGDRGEQEGKARDFQSTPVASKAFVPLEVEVEVPSFCKKGAYVWATGLVGGVRKPFGFKAVVVAIRSRFPKIHVKYLEDRETASSVRIALPEMREAYLMADAVSEYDGQ